MQKSAGTNKLQISVLSDMMPACAFGVMHGHSLKESLPCTYRCEFMFLHTSNSNPCYRRAREEAQALKDENEKLKKELSELKERAASDGAACEATSDGDDGRSGAK